MARSKPKARPKPAPRSPAQGVHLVKITTRLFSDDIAAIKAQAELDRGDWQVVLRHLVHDALKNKERAKNGVLE